MSPAPPGALWGQCQQHIQSSSQAWKVQTVQTIQNAIYLNEGRAHFAARSQLPRSVQNPFARFSNIVLRWLSFAIVNRHILANVHVVGGVILIISFHPKFFWILFVKSCAKRDVGALRTDGIWKVSRGVYLLGACNVLAGSLLSVVHLSHLNRTYYLNTSTLQHLSHLNRTPTLLPPTSLNCSSLRETQRHLDPYTILPPQTE